MKTFLPVALTFALFAQPGIGQELLPLPGSASSKPSPSTSSYRLLKSRTGEAMTLRQLADELAKQDIVYFGEFHDNETGHRVYAELAPMLVERRPDTVISLEMFERDVQGVVNDYLRGRIDEAAFLKHSRPWKNYARDYRPQIELACERKLDVIAGNLPRSVSGKVASKEGSMSPFLPRMTTAPMDRYWELFAETMKGHPGAEGATERMYKAQCAKDDAMAEGIADYLASNPHRQPLVIHRNGNFHSDYGLGTAARVSSRVPLAQAAIISMVAVNDVATADVSKDRKKGHYLLIVPAPPKPAPAPEKPSETKPKKK
jgi:uncharacterized iron-regulated protein